MARTPRVEPPPQGSSPPPKWRRGQGNRRIREAADVAADAKRRARRLQVFELKIASAASFERIGRELGITGRQAKKDYARACLEYGQETAAQHKAKANARFDADVGRINRVLARLTPYVDSDDGKPDLEAVARVASLVRTKALIEATQAKMNGAFAPVKVEHTGADGGPIKMSLDDLERAIQVGRDNAADEPGDSLRVEH